MFGVLRFAWRSAVWLPLLVLRVLLIPVTLAFGAAAVGAFLSDDPGSALVLAILAGAAAEVRARLLVA